MTTNETTLRALLAQARTIAVVGLSADPARPSHRVARYLQRAGYRIVPVNPTLIGRDVLGEPVLASLRDAQGPVDIVDVFRRTEEVAPVARDAVAVGARALWQQVGVVNGEADRIATDAGLVSVMDRCLMVDHQVLVGG